MSEYVIDIKEKGVGILCDIFDEERAAELEAQRTPEERRARADAEAERIAAEKLSQEAIKLGYEELSRRAEKEAADAVLRPVLDAIDKNLAPHLKNELAEENATARLSERQKQDFALFQKCAARWELPHLPAPPGMVAVFLSEESEKGAAHVDRLCHSIASVHRAFNFPDPTTDILVRAVVRLCRSESNKPPQQQKD
jgi:hypothetical protein